MKFFLPLLLLLIVFTSCSKTGDTKKSEPLTDLINVQYGSNLDTSGNMVSLNLDLYFPANEKKKKKYPLVL
jgi:hypothetical protein